MPFQIEPNEGSLNIEDKYTAFLFFFFFWTISVDCVYFQSFNVRFDSKKSEQKRILGASSACVISYVSFLQLFCVLYLMSAT